MHQPPNDTKDEVPLNVRKQRLRTSFHPCCHQMLNKNKMMHANVANIKLNTSRSDTLEEIFESDRIKGTYEDDSQE